MPLIVDPDQPQFRVLVLEDDPANSRLLRRVLEGAGFQIRTAEDGEPESAYFASGTLISFWMDVHLPGMNGLEAAAHIRRPAGKR